MKSETSPLRGWFSLMKIIFDYNRTIFDPETGTLFLGVFDMLLRLAKSNELFLVSRNEPGREDVLDSFNIKKFFKRIEFTDNKNEELFLSMIGKDKNVMIVGDSIKGEITLGNKLKLITVRVLQGTFASQISTFPVEQAQFEIKNVTELERILKLYEN